MVFLVSTDLRIRLARPPFEARYPQVRDRVGLKPYAELLASAFDLGATHVLCSVSCFSAVQRRVAQLWEAAVARRCPQARIVNRPSLVPHWTDLMALAQRNGHRTAATWSLADQLREPRFPIVLRQQTPEFQLDSPVIDDPEAIPEIVDRMVLAGGSPEGFLALSAGTAMRGEFHSLTTLLRIGEATFPSGEPAGYGDLEAMKAMAMNLPLEVAAFDFLVDERGPLLWRIDDELCRLLPGLVDPRRAPSDAPRLEALANFGEATECGGRESIEIDVDSVQAALMCESRRGVK